MPGDSFRNDSSPRAHQPISAHPPSLLFLFLTEDMQYRLREYLPTDMLPRYPSYPQGAVRTLRGIK